MPVELLRKPPTRDAAPSARELILRSPFIARLAALEHDIPNGTEALAEAERVFSEELNAAFRDGCDARVATVAAFVKADGIACAALDAFPDDALAILNISEDVLRALADLRARASRFAATLPPPKLWAEFYDAEVLPAWQRLAGSLRRCPDCRTLFAPSLKDQEFCSKGCGSRKRNRGRTTKRARQNAASLAMRKHVGGCALCQNGKPCPRFETILARAPSSDCLSRVADGLAPEDAEEMTAARGRVRSRRTP